MTRLNDSPKRLNLPRRGSVLWTISRRLAADRQGKGCHIAEEQRRDGGVPSAVEVQ